MQLTKVLTTAIILLFTCSFSYAQDDDNWEKVHNNEFSLNIKQAVNIFFFPSNPQIDPYMLQYRHYIGGGAIRAGLGVNVSNRTRIQHDTIELQSNSFNTDLRLGWQFNREIDKRFLFYYGADLFYSSSSSFHENFNSPSQGFITNESRSLTVGLSPMLGVQFYITPRISLGTEAAFKIGRVNTFSEVIYENWPQNSQKTESSGITTSYMAPNSLYLNFRF